MSAKKAHKHDTEMEVRVALKDPKVREEIVMAQQHNLKDAGELKIEAKETATAYRKRIKAIEKEIAEQSVQLTQGMPELRKVTVIRDFEGKRYKVVDRETKAVYEDRKMTKEDQQLPLGGEESDGEDAGDDETVTRH